MLKHSHSGPLKVALLALSPHNRAILEFFFAGAGRNLFRVVAANEADAFILDYDHPQARSDWEAHAAQHKPGIVLSVHEVALTNIVWIPKPLTSRALSDAAEQVRNLIAPQMPAPPVAQRPALSSTGNPLPEKTLVRTSEQRLHETGKLFGTNPSSTNKLRSLVISLPDEDEDETEEALLGKPASQPLPSEPIFDPAEADIPLEEVDRPVEDSVSPEQAERRWKQLCGEHEDGKTAADISLFTPENYLLPHIVEAFQRCRDAQQTIQVKFAPWDYALLMPKTGLAYCTLDTQSAAFAALCNNPLQTEQIELHIPTEAELQQLEQRATDAPESVLDLEAFVWVSSLLTARGCLARNVDAGRKISLKHWPNLTRLEQFPHIMRIAALWNQRPASPLEIASALAVPQRYVFAFHTAANALNLFEMDQNKLKSREKEKPKENRGFFSRLLKRLLGGGSK